MKANIKIKIKTNNKQKENNYKAIVSNDYSVFKYIEEDTTKTVFDMNKNVLSRENDELYMEYFFDKNKGKVYIKEIDKEFLIDLKKVKVDRKDNNIKISYNIDEDKFIYELEVL